MATVIDGSASVTINSGAVLGITSGTVNAGGTNPFPSSGGPTAVDFTGIPSWVKRITVMFSGVSTSGTANPIVQLGTSSGATTSGYVGTGSECGSTTAASSFTSGFGIRSAVATNTVQGVLVIYCLSSSSNIWVASGVTAQPSSAFTHQIAGTVTLGGTLDRVRITTTGSDTFDAGSINILYE